MTDYEIGMMILLAAGLSALWRLSMLQQDRRDKARQYRRDAVMVRLIMEGKR